MTTPLPDKNEKNTDNVNKSDDDSLSSKFNPKSIFSLFQLGNEFAAHRNLVLNVRKIFKYHPLKDIFNHLEIYQITLKTFESVDIDKLAAVLPNYGKRKTPLYSFDGNQVIAALLMEEPKKSLAVDAVRLFQLLLILAIMAKECDESILTKAALKLRLATAKADKEEIFETFNSMFGGIHNTRQLFNIINTNTSIKENGRARDLINSFKDLIKSIPLSATKICDIQQSRAFVDTEDVSIITTSIPITFQTTNKSAYSEPHDQCIVYTEDNKDVFTDIANQKISKEVKDHVSVEDITETKKSAMKTSKALREITSGYYSHYYTDNDYNNYATNLFNEIERNWLADALKQVATNPTENATSLVIALSVCLSVNYSEVLEMVISDEDQITTDGYFRKVIPDLDKPVKPSTTDRLYIEHVNDSSSPYIYLPLPDFVVNKINEIPKVELLKKPKISDLFNESDDPSELVKNYVNDLKETYGQRFITNRLSCQLRQYTKSKHNDPALTYALFGNKTQRAPAAFYYRAFNIGKLVGTYDNLVTCYFK